MAREINTSEIGQRIRNLRNSKRITQETLAELSDLSLTHISNLENGRTKMSIESLVAISDALSVSTDTILFGEIPNSSFPYYREFMDVMYGCTDFEKNIITENAYYMKNLLKETQKQYYSDK